MCNLSTSFNFILFTLHSVLSFGQTIGAGAGINNNMYAAKPDPEIQTKFSKNKPTCSFYMQYQKNNRYLLLAELRFTNVHINHHWYHNGAGEILDVTAQNQYLSVAYHRNWLRKSRFNLLTGVGASVLTYSKLNGYQNTYNFRPPNNKNDTLKFPENHFPLSNRFNVFLAAGFNLKLFSFKRASIGLNSMFRYYPVSDFKRWTIWKHNFFGLSNRIYVQFNL